MRRTSLKITVLATLAALSRRAGLRRRDLGRLQPSPAGPVATFTTGLGGLRRARRRR